MREILFRGRRTDNGNWIYGDLLQLRRSNKPTLTFIMEQTPTASNYPVDPATVGQYTGLTDKNGAKIWEGDIVRYGEPDDRYCGQYPVVFETRGSSAYFGIAINDVETWRFCLEVPSKIMEVVGNIHDTAEQEAQ